MQNQDNFDKNILLEKFSNHFGNKKREFLEFAQEKGFENPDQIIENLENIQDFLFNHVLEVTMPDKNLNANELKIISENYLKNKYSWIDETGIEAINRWLFWMSWHEGILKS